MISPAAERNKGPILEVLRTWVGERWCRVLEIGSGTGQHAAYFSAQLPRVTWQPSDIGGYLPPLRHCVIQQGRKNLLPPIELDVNRFVGVPAIDIIYTANTLHIMSWDSARAFLREAGRRLLPGSLLMVYGPFNVGGRATSPSNAHFDAALRGEDPAMGIRDREHVCGVADRAGLSLQKIHAMPANNQLLVFARRAR